MSEPLVVKIFGFMQIPVTMQDGLSQTTELSMSAPCACYAYAWVTCRSTQCISACIRAVRHAHMHIARRPTMFMCAWVQERTNSHAAVVRAGKADRSATRKLELCRHSKGGSKPWLIKGGGVYVCFLFHLLSIFFLLLSSPLLLLIFSTRTRRDTNWVIREPTNRLNFYRFTDSL
jgi:hypothetical protein